MPDITYDVGRVSFIMKGAWNLATNYEKLDAVSYNGSLYIAKQDVPGGTAITNTTYWQLAAEKGDKGDTGGVDSVNGQQGDVWFPDSRQLISDGYTTDTDPFLVKGNDSDSDRFELTKRGNTVGVNQLLPALDNKTQNDITGTRNADGSYTVNGTATGLFEEYKSFAMITGHRYLFFGFPSGASDSTTYGYVFSARRYAPVILTATSSGTTSFSIIVPNGATVNNVKWYPEIRDLTRWFGSNDRIPADLLAHPENWGDYYAGPLDYEPGRLESADGTVLTSFGTDGITVLTAVDTGSEVLRSAGAVADEKTPDGTITRRVGVVDLGTLTWNYDSGNDYMNVSTALPNAERVLAGSVNAIAGCEYLLVNAEALGSATTKAYTLYDGRPFFKNTGYTDPAAFKSSMSGVYLYYELATPTTEQGTAFAPIVATVKNGVLSWTNTKGIPVGHESHWFENLRKRVEDRLPDPPSGDGTYRLTCTISGGVKTYSWEA